jgi:iron complex transport system substrate-binding protein
MARGRLFAVIIAGWLVTGGCCGSLDRQARSEASDAEPRRIISLAPSLTETLFALGLGDRVVGVTRYCAHPSAVVDLPKVGGHLDPNIEAIVALSPDLVVAIPSSRENGQRLESVGIRVLEVDQHDVEAVLESVLTIADACGVSERGRALTAELRGGLERVRSIVGESPRPRAVVVIGHQVGGGSVRSVWVAGPDTFYDGVLQIAGGVNAIEGGLVRYPEMSREGLASLDPDVVLDLVAGIEERDLDIGRLRQEWERLTELRAVRENRVRVLEGDLMVVPGPRLPEMVEVIARSLHPELDWSAE